MSEQWERGEHPAQAEVHEPIQGYDLMDPPAEFAVCDIAGDELDRGTVLHEMIEWAKERLSDDPEIRELTVWAIDPSGNLLTHLRTITFGPDASWNSVVVVLKPGEHVQAPGPVPHRISEEDLEGYSLDDPKRISLEQRLGEWT